MIPGRAARRVLGAAAAVALLLAIAGARAGERAPGGPERGASPLTPELAASVEAIERRLETLRGLAYRAPVSTAMLTRQAARAFIRDVLRRDYPTERMRAEQQALEYFGLLRPGEDLEDLLLGMLESQVAGLYDPARKTLFVVPGPAAGAAALAHELAHALADQHYDLSAMQDAAMVDDDRALALSALVEGEASMVMTLWGMQSLADPNTPALFDGGEEALTAAGASGLEGAPAFLRESLLFPYTAGTAWAAERMRLGGGLKALDEFFRTPPESTEQILHPERSGTSRDLPSRVDDALLRDAPGSGRPIVKLDTMGEFAIRLLLGAPDASGASAAADGWDGDRYLLAGPAKDLRLTWISAWDSEEDALEFASAATAWLERRGRGARGGRGVERRGRVVVVAEGPGGGTSMDRAAAIAGSLPAGIEFR